MDSSRRIFIGAAGAAGLVSATGAPLSAWAAAKTVVIGVVYVGPRDDFGYNQAQAQAAARAPSLAKELRAASDALQLPPEMAMVQEDSRSTAQRLATALEGLAADKELEPRLLQAQRVVRTLAAPGAEPGPVVTPGPPTATGALLSADFETDAPQGWMMSPGAAVTKTDQGGVLACSEMGHGLWIAQFPPDFTMKLRYRHGTGLGHIAFRGTGELPKDNDYRLRLDGTSATLARAEGGQETVLASRGLPLKPGTWYALGIQVIGGRIAVAVDGARVVEATDPVSYTHLRAHETVLELVCRLLLEKKNTIQAQENRQTEADKESEKVRIRR